MSLRFKFIIVIIIISCLVNVFTPEKKQLIIVDNESYSTEQVKDNDIRVKDIWEEGYSFIVNNSNTRLLVEGVKYYTTGYDPYNPVDPVTHIIDINTTYPAKFTVDYFFTRPPKEIQTQSSTSTTRWVLKRQD